MKTFGQILSEVSQPKAEDEKDFKAKHITTIKMHPQNPDPDDEIFHGGTKKAPKRLADYDKGEDELVYEGSFDSPVAAGGEHDSEDSHKMYKKGNKSSKTVKEAKKLDPVGKADADIDNDGDVDSSDKYLHNRRKAISKAIKNESVESLDEISRDLARSYIRKAAADNKERKADVMKPFPLKDMEKNVSQFKKMKSREKGIETAGKKAYNIGGKAKVPATESVELDEKLKASADMGTWIKDFQKSDAPQFKGKSKEKRRQMAIAAKYGAEREAGMREETNLEEKVNEKQIKKDLDSGMSHDAVIGKHANKRTTNTDEIRKVIQQHAWNKRMKKEETENLDEISKKTLASYVNKASYDAASNAAKYGAGQKTKKGGDAFVKAHQRLSGIKKATERLTKEEVEQLDELSPNTLHRYIKKAAGNLGGSTAIATAQALSPLKKASPDVTRNIKNRMKGITGASGRLADKANMAEDAYEEIPMMLSQLEFICYAAEEIMDYLQMTADPEEWYQNKLANAHQTMMSLYSYARGEMRMSSNYDDMDDMDDMYGESVKEELVGGQKKLDHNKNGKIDAQDFHMMRKKKKMAEETELDESITKMSHARLKWHMNSGVPHGSYTKDEMKKERDRRLKSGEGEAYRAAKASLSEVARSAVKKAVTYTDARGKSVTRLAPITKVDRDESGQEKIRESVLDEAFKAGSLKLKDGSSVTVKNEDAKILNQLMGSLNEKNRQTMESTLMANKKGFDEILSFAKEAL